MEENQNQNPQTSVEVKEQNAHTDGSIDFSGVSALASTDWKPDPWIKRFGNAILEKLISLGLFLFGIILDVFKTLFVIVRGIFLGIFKIFVGIGRFFRSVARMCMEGDRYVKCSTFCQGLRNIKGKQVGDGIVFLTAEILFVLYMVLFGGKAIFNLIFIGEQARLGLPGDHAQWDLVYDDEFGEWVLPNQTSMRFLIAGVMTIFLIAIYVYIWYMGMKSAHDNYIVFHNFRFMQARADQITVVEHASEYGEFFDVIEKKDKEGNPYHVVKYKSKHQILKLARQVYGFSELSARYISYVPLNHLQERKLGPVRRFFYGIKSWFHRGYDKVRQKIKAGKWSYLFGKYLEWELLPPKNKYGFKPVHDLVLGGFNRYRHTYDKYNDYLSVVRDSESLLRVLKDPELIEKAIYAEDPVSVKNGLEPVARGTKVKPKVAASRIVGAFECSYNDGVTVASYYLRALKDQPKTNVAPVDKLHAIYDTLKEKLDNFVRINSKERKEGMHKTEELYLDFATVMPAFGKGRKAFIEEMVNVHRISKTSAITLYNDINYAQKQFKDDEEKVRDFLSKRSVHIHDLVERYDTYPFHGQPMHFSKKVKQYADEKFAVTVLALPVLGALITSIIPLLVSILIAFTNFTNANASIGNFDWSLVAWQNMFGGTSGKASMAGTFMYILGWTFTWAIFATFTNYILGIVLALLINKKSIKLKKVYRMFFVISIAIPQFVTLLAMSKILGPGGPLHTWLREVDPNTTDLNYFLITDWHNQGLTAKLCLIFVNVWIGIPYTMLSTSGILMNIPEDLYESASIDGANPWTQFWKITMPYILFVTGPSLLTSFIGNINNFNVIFFLTGGGPTPEKTGILATNAGYTDLLITYLFKITVNSGTHEYALGSVIGILVFAICSFFSLIMYARMGSTKNEEAFQ